MPKQCDITKKKYNRANKVSFSNKHHRYQQHVNLQYKSFWDPETQRFVRLRVTTKMIKTITKYGLRSALKRFDADPAILCQ